MANGVIIDTSTLINFLRVDRVDLLAGLTAFRFLVTDNVRAEVLTTYPDQHAILDLALQAGHIHVISLTDSAEVAAYAAMQRLRVLGDGECSAIAAAYVRGLPLAMDDGVARKKTAAHYPTVTLLDSVGLVVDAIRTQLLSVAQADAIKVDWETNHKFKKPQFSSFRELLP